MTWVRLDDDYASHRKVRPLSDAAFRLNTSAMCWAAKHLTDGAVSTEDLPLVSDVRKPAPAVRELVARGLWEITGEGWMIHDFLDYNDPAKVIRDKRDRAAERQRRARAARWGEPVTPDVTRDIARDSHSGSQPDSRGSHGVSHDPLRPDPSRPVPKSIGGQDPQQQPGRNARGNPAAAAQKIIIEATDAAPAEAAELAARIADDRRPRNLPGLVQCMADDGDLVDALAQLRFEHRRIDHTAAIYAARSGPVCPHDEPGGASPHPGTGKPLCPLCRQEASA